jgi:hypothetical protein
MTRHPTPTIQTGLLSGAERYLYRFQYFWVYNDDVSHDYKSNDTCDYFLF